MLCTSCKILHGSPIQTKLSASGMLVLLAELAGSRWMLSRAPMPSDSTMCTPTQSLAAMHLASGQANINLLKVTVEGMEVEQGSFWTRRLVEQEKGQIWQHSHTDIAALVWALLHPWGSHRLGKGVKEEFYLPLFLSLPLRLMGAPFLWRLNFLPAPHNLQSPSGRM